MKEKHTAFPQGKSRRVKNEVLSLGSPEIRALVQEVWDRGWLQELPHKWYEQLELWQKYYELAQIRARVRWYVLGDRTRTYIRWSPGPGEWIPRWSEVNQ